MAQKRTLQSSLFSLINNHSLHWLAPNIKKREEEDEKNLIVEHSCLIKGLNATSIIHNYLHADKQTYK